MKKTPKAASVKRGGTKAKATLPTIIPGLNVAPEPNITKAQWDANPALRQRLTEILSDPVFLVAEVLVEQMSPSAQLSGVFAATVTENGTALAGMVSGWERRKNALKFLTVAPSKKTETEPSYGVTEENARD